ncbi:PepSY domain-containing protein [Streptomyces sp. NPDC026673]|uniref:PepSY domain-containing protein n=1 Tax=Streptomyces sp. NPDC026673 TaxID=3155724 RepID=UPI0033D411DB
MRRKTLIAAAAAVAVLAGTGGVAAAAFADDDRQRPAAVSADTRDDDTPDTDTADTDTETDGDDTRDDDRVSGGTDRAAGTRTVSLADAVASARAEAPGTAVSAELDDDRGGTDWEVEILAEDGTWHEVTIDAADGKVVSTHQEQDRQDAAEARGALRGSKTDLLDAAEAASSARPGGTVTSVSLDDDSRTWEVDVRSGKGTTHEVHVDPVSGDTT